MSFLEEEYKNTLEICTYYIENSHLLYLKFWKQEPAAGAEIYGVLFDKIHEAREIIFETHEFRKIEFETHEKKLTLAIVCWSNVEKYLYFSLKKLKHP